MDDTSGCWSDSDSESLRGTTNARRDISRVHVDSVRNKIPRDGTGLIPRDSQHDMESYAKNELDK